MPVPDDALRITTDVVAGAPVMLLAGELDLAAEEALTTALLELEATVPPLIAVDLTALAFMDSTGSRVLIEAHQRAEEGGRRFVVVAGAGPAREVLERSGLTDYLAVSGDVGGIAAARPVGDEEDGGA